MTKIYVSGFTGMIGRSIVSALNAMSYQCVKLGRTEDADIQFDLDDICHFDYGSIDSGSKFIFLSAISSPDLCETNSDMAWRVNVVNTLKFINKLLEKNVEVLFASSDVVYGAKADAINTEESICSPIGVYAKSKYEIEKAFYKHAGFHVMRLSYVMSPSDRFISYLEKCHLNEYPAEVFHPFSRSIVAINDVVDFCIGFLLNRNTYPAVVNLCGDELISRLDLAKAFSKRRKIEIKIIEPDASFFAVRQKIISCKSLHLRAVLGRSPVNVLKNLV
jgi:nucleoside-diphosphate-sugar epimerase